MRPLMQKYTLESIKNLTYNVFELEFIWENEINVIPWQFITFMIDWIWARAYSILEKNEKKLKFIIKKLEIEEWWRWWSKFLCELNSWVELKWIWASWHFILQKNSENKLFLWTWTWLVPLYFQIKSWLEEWRKEKMKLVFWVRTKKDIFYLEELNSLKEKYLNFDFEIYLSNEESEEFKNWYITKELEILDKTYKEIYLCGNPNMIDSAREILLKNDFLKENIFEEKY